MLQENVMLSNEVGDQEGHFGYEVSQATANTGGEKMPCTHARYERPVSSAMDDQEQVFELFHTDSLYTDRHSLQKFEPPDGSNTSTLFGFSAYDFAMFLILVTSLVAIASCFLKLGY